MKEIHKSIVVLALLVLFDFAVADEKCQVAFKTINDLNIVSCSQGKIELRWFRKGKVVKAEGSVVEGNDAFMQFDLQTKNGFIEPANSGRYITKIDRHELLQSRVGQIQVIHSNYIFGDGVLERANVYYACKKPTFSKCLTLEFMNSLDKEKEIKIILRAMEVEW